MMRKWPITDHYIRAPHQLTKLNVCIRMIFLLGSKWSKEGCAVVQPQFICIHQPACARMPSLCEFYDLCGNNPIIFAHSGESLVFVYFMSKALPKTTPPPFPRPRWGSGLKQKPSKAHQWMKFIKASGPLKPKKPVLNFNLMFNIASDRIETRSPWLNIWLLTSRRWREQAKLL